ncbi:MAG: hypothetical protein JXR91_00180 [Deltaproteobacteria bacterium]|nr:hypothetical protein [Deltaproteobacteria bacterium]
MTNFKNIVIFSKEAIKHSQSFAENSKGTASVEEIIILMAVAVGFSAAMVAVGPMLLNYHSGIEFVLSLPVP